MAYSKNPIMPNRDINELIPYVAWTFLELQRRCKKVGINIILTNGYRLPAYQDSIYAQGRTTKGSIVTKVRGKYSYHCWRMAFDYAVIINGKANYEDKWYGMVANISRTIPYLESGYYFKSFHDPCHMQVTMGLTTQDLINKKVPKFPPIPQPKPIIKPNPKLPVKK